MLVGKNDDEIKIPDFFMLFMANGIFQSFVYFLAGISKLEGES